MTEPVLRPDDAVLRPGDRVRVAHDVLARVGASPTVTRTVAAIVTRPDGTTGGATSGRQRTPGTRLGGLTVGDKHVTIRRVCRPRHDDSE